jgi:hypothetical protein
MEISESIRQLCDFWSNQGMSISSGILRDIDKIDLAYISDIPADFIDLYESVNGMEELYPNDFDAEGFLFYPIEAIIPARLEFENSGQLAVEKIYIFAEYMHKSWWYGYQLTENNDYMIGIIETKDVFKPIADSLSEFLNLYMRNASILYG